MITVLHQGGPENEVYRESEWSTYKEMHFRKSDKKIQPFHADPDHDKIISRQKIEGQSRLIGKCEKCLEGKESKTVRRSVQRYLRFEIFKMIFYVSKGGG